MTRRTRRMTHAFLLLWIALAMIDCGKYGRPSRVGMAPPPGAAPAAAEECEDPDDDCMVVWAQPETNPNTDEIYSGAYMQAYTPANIAHVSTGWVTREGYRWGLDNFPYLRADAGTTGGKVHRAR